MDHSIRVLVVDDMPAMRSIVRGMLEEIGFRRIAEAEDGEIAWQLIQAAANDSDQAYSLIVADWNMPGMTGVDLLRAVRSFGPTRGVSFLMVTAKGDHAHFSEAVRAGVTDYVVKPFSSAQLREKIQTLFGQS